MRVHCPKCRPSAPLRETQPVECLTTYSCHQCEGMFVSSDDYLTWQQTRPEISRSRDANALAPEVELDLAEDSFDALICPECRRIMLKYNVGHGVPFKVDFCSTCNGVWLDKREWESLAARNLHDEINYFFTDAWQGKVRRAEMGRKLHDLFRARIGDQAFTKVEEFSQWLDQQPFRSEVLAYLQDEPPEE